MHRGDASPDVVAIFAFGFVRSANRSYGNAARSKGGGKFGPAVASPFFVGEHRRGMNDRIVSVGNRAGRRGGTNQLGNARDTDRVGEPQRLFDTMDTLVCLHTAMKYTSLDLVAERHIGGDACMHASGHERIKCRPVAALS